MSYNPYENAIFGSIEGDFWEQNPHAKFIEPFSELVGTKNGSKLMWAMYLLEDPKTPYKSGTKEEKIRRVAKVYLKVDPAKFDYDKLKKYWSMWSAFMTQEELVLEMLEESFNNRVTQMLSKLREESTAENAEASIESRMKTVKELRELMKNVKDLFNELRQQRNVLGQAFSMYALKGGGVMGLREYRAIQAREK